jgi:hypothetical protein
MNSFDDRERAEEFRFALNQEQEFKAHARRARLLGEWAAGVMGLQGDEALAYAKSVVISDLEEPGEEDLYRKIHDDLQAAGSAQTEHQIRAHMADLMLTARRQIAEQG